MSEFSTVKKLVAARFAKMVKSGETLLNTEYDRDLIWLHYIENFAPEKHQENNCNCCKAFFRQIGGVVTVDANNQRHSIWDIPEAEVPDEFKKPITEVRKYVASCPIKGLYYHENINVGVDKNQDIKRSTPAGGNWYWEHYSLKIPDTCVDTGNMPTVNAAFVSSKQVMERAMKELKPEAIEIALDIILQDKMPKGNEAKPKLMEFKKLQQQFTEIHPDNRVCFAWRMAVKASGSVAHIRNSAMGTFLIDVSGWTKEDGTVVPPLDLNRALDKYGEVTDPRNYKRSSGIVTTPMIETAKKKLEENGYLPSLDRRRLDERDLPADKALFIYRPTQRSGSDIFTTLVNETPTDPKRLEKVQEVSAEKFIRDIVPNAKALKILFERSHQSNLITLTGPSDETAKSMFQWDNAFGWSYAGGYGDAIKEKVKARGGKVDGVWMRMSLDWYNHDDLDLHFVSGHVNTLEQGVRPKIHVYHGQKNDNTIQSRLDVDANVGHCIMDPVENIYIERKLPEGNYTALVRNHCQRHKGNNEGYELEIEVNGETFNFCAHNNPRTGDMTSVKFTVAKDGTVSFPPNPMSKSASGTVKWGLKTGLWHRVNAVTLSPNHWTKPVGTKHLIFILDGCRSDEATRPFLNEFLLEDLYKDAKKVMEVLGSKLEVKPAEGNELSGLGFNETTRTHAYVEVEGAFKSIVKVTF